LIGSLLAAALFSGCRERPQRYFDGYYTAEAQFFDDHGWKEFVTIYVNNNKIVTVEYNAKNASGFIKSWDMDYMRIMNAVDGTYPNEYTRTYSTSLLVRQDPAQVEALTGATNSYRYFKLLSTHAVAMAKQGNKTIAFVDVSEMEER
jgi:major membrane immunogen (membrane-anchored lipoprotein)